MPGMDAMIADQPAGEAGSGEFWGFVPRESIMGRPLFNYWSFQAPDDKYEKTGLGTGTAWIAQVALHFFTYTRWRRSFARVG
jgi:signal peptidase I